MASSQSERPDSSPWSRLSGPPHDAFPRGWPLTDSARTASRKSRKSGKSRATPIRVEVVTKPECCRVCDASLPTGVVGHLSPDSLAARLIEVGRTAARYYDIVDDTNRGDMEALDPFVAFQAALTDLRSHADYRPDQKERTSDGD